jgi:hypothetical protein
MFGERPKKSVILHASFQLQTWRRICDVFLAISWYYAGPKTTPNGRITSCDYVDILGNQLHPVVQMLFPNHDAYF